MATEIVQMVKRMSALYQRKDGTTTAADDAALVAALVKRARQGARRLRLVAKGAILPADCPSFKV